MNEGREAAETPVDAQPNRRMHVHPVAYVFFGLYFVVAIISAGSRLANEGPGLGVGELVGSIAAMNLVVLALGYVAWLVARRSRLVVTIVVSLLLLFGTLGELGRISNLGRRSLAMTQLQRDQDHLLDRIEQQLEQALASSDGAVTGGAELLQEMADRIHAAARDVSPRERDVLQAAAAIMSDLAAHVRDYETEMAAFLEVGGNDFSNIGTRDDLSRRIERIEAMQMVNTRFIGFIQSIEADLAQRLEQVSGLSANERRRWGQRFLEGMDVDLLLAIREADTRILAAGRGMLAVLDREWGRWEVDPRSQMILFEDTQALKKFNHHFEGMEAAAQRQIQLQQGILDRLRNRRGTTP